MRRLLMLVLTGLTAMPATAFADAVSEVKAKLLELYPATPIDDVRPTPVAGLFEVAMGRKIVYVDSTGRYFVFGRIFDLPGNRDLTEERLQETAKLDLSQIRADQVLEQGKGDQVLYVFSDPGCGHCQKLEQTLAGMPALRVKTILLPLQPGSAELARDIWCAPDRSLAWSSWMRKGVRPPRAAESCRADVLQQNLSLAKAAGVRATPALVAPDGRVSLGALEAPALAAWLNPHRTAISTNSTEVAK